MPTPRLLVPLLLICTVAQAQAPTASNTARVRMPEGIANSGQQCLAANGSAGFDAASGACTAVDADPVGVAAATVVVRKSAVPAAGSQVRPGDEIAYRLEAVVAGAALAAPLRLVDTPADGLRPLSLPQGCERDGAALVCTVPAGAAPGTYAFDYRAAVEAGAGGEVANAVAASGGGDAVQPQCPQCRLVHAVAADAQLKIGKSAAPRKVKVGDLVRYQLTIENIGRGDVRAATVVDTPPPGFSLVPGSLQVSDRDGAGRLLTQQPIAIGDIDVAAAGTARVQYLLRVGAGVRPGTHVNRARAEDGGAVVSNEASASVESVADPLLDESLILGTVFDDRDRDGWQDPAGLSGLQARGGFAADAYLAGSTTLSRDGATRALADASAPLLRGVELGDLRGRRSDADPGAPPIVLSQVLRRPDFAGDFVLTSREGFRVRMDADGRVRVESAAGEAAKGLSAAAPRVERRVGQVADGYRVDYVISNAGVEERGLPGVRVAAVEGLLAETDAFGRYHLPGIDAGRWERGRQFTLKVDPATLPRGSAFTTDNPRLRRITPGLPTRYDFGVAMPPGVRAQRREEELVLAEFVFDAGSARLDPRYAPLVAHVAEWAREHPGGGIVMDAQALDRGLAYRRAVAVREAVLARLATAAPQARAPRIEVRADAERVDSTVLTVGDAVVLGTVLFDTDRVAIRPEFAGLLDRIAADIAAMDDPGEYRIAVTGHADRRASDAYNLRLGMRRARAVFDALATRLAPPARQRLRVDIGPDRDADADADAGENQE